MSTDTQPNEYLVGPTTLALTALAFNLAARRIGHPTISASVRWLRRQPVGGWVLGAIVGALLAHWFLEGETP